MMSRNNVIVLMVAVLIAAGGIWYGVRQDETAGPDPAAGSPGAAPVIEGVVQDDSGRRVLYWYDPMVPQHRFEQPGRSPFMDMQLVPKYADEVSEGGVSISPQVQQNLGIRTVPATRESVPVTVRAVGEIRANERAIEMVQNRVTGFVEKLLVRAEGDPVKRGQKLAEVYAPDLLAAQEELLALNQLDELQGVERLRQAARARLRLLGMSPEEIREVERSGEAAVRIGIYSPRDGIVQALGIREGAAVQPGDTLFEIVDLSQVWLNLEVPERQIGQLEDAERVEVSVPAYPGETFTGEVDYIYPTIETTTRTVPVRVVLANEQGRLKPGMYAEATIIAGEHKGLWVPSQAVIQTGERSLVIVKGDEGFRPVRVQTGQQRDERTEILQGLREGEQVVASGQFLIDSEASLSGVLARLNPPQQPSEAGELHQGEGVLENYDMDTGMVTLTHGPIPSLDWPGMTMPFKLSNPHALHGVAPGSTIRFMVQAAPQDGNYVIEEVEVIESADTPAERASEQPQPGPALHEGVGVVQEYDMNEGTVLLAHEPIASLDWPAMTMPFKLRNPHALHGVEPGARVKFQMRGEAEEGQYVIEQVEILGGRHD